MTPKKTLLNFFVDDTLLDRIEDFRFKNRFPTRAAAIKCLLDWALKQKPSLKSMNEKADFEVEKEAPSVEAPRPVPAPEPAVLAAVPAEAAPPPPPMPDVPKTERTPGPSLASMMQVLRDQGYEVGEAVHHPDGQERTLIRSQDGSAWVNAQQLQDLAASRITLSDISLARAAGR